MASQQGGLRTDNFYSAFLHGRIAYHDFEGVTIYPEEKSRLVADLGAKDIMLLRNHGPLVVGRSIPEALITLWTVQRACEIQLAAQSGGAPTLTVSPEAIRASQQARDKFDNKHPRGQLEFDALVREIDKIDESYKR